MAYKLIFQLLQLANVVYSFDVYCGNVNCYKVLGVDRTATDIELTEALYQIEQECQLDRNKDGSADATYHRALTAYDILRNPNTRREYDDILDNPDRLLYHYYQYFKHRVSPNINVQRLVVISILVISVIQYIYKKHLYASAVRDAMRSPKFRNQALHKIQEERIMDGNYKKRKYWEEELVLRKLVEDSILTKGKYKIPRVTDTLFVQILLAPYNFLFHMKWLQKLDVFKEEYEDMPSYQKLRKSELSTKNVSPLNECSDGSYDDTETWLNNNNIPNYKEELNESKTVGDKDIKRRRSEK